MNFITSRWKASGLISIIVKIESFNFSIRINSCSYIVFILKSMSYIEKKYRQQISLVFTDLSSQEKFLLDLLEKKSFKYTEEIAKNCSEIVKQINIILKKLYPEITNLEDKISIKSTLRFYYDLIDKLTDYIRHVENFHKIGEEYYDSIINFIKNKDKLVNGKFKRLATQELTTFYNPKAREELEGILEEKLRVKSQEFFTIGPFEQEIKKRARLAGATEIRILTATANEKLKKGFGQSVIRYKININNETLLEKVGNEIKELLISKGYKAENTKPDFIITDAKMLPDPEK